MHALSIADSTIDYIRCAYYKKCYKTVYRFLRRPRRVHFVQFETYRLLEHQSSWGTLRVPERLAKPLGWCDLESANMRPMPAQCHVGIHDKPDAIPPSEQVHAGRWEYEPVPLVGRPISNERFLHYLLHPERHPDTNSAVYVSRIAKKLGQSASDQAETEQRDRVSFEWGLHVIEEPDAMVFGCLGCAALVAGLVVSLIVGSHTKSYPQGFGVGCGLAALMTTLLVYVYNLLKDSDYHGKSA